MQLGWARATTRVSLLRTLAKYTATGPRSRQRAAPHQSNDVDIDDRGLIYLANRNIGFDPRSRAG